MKSETKNCKNCKAEFVIEPNDFGFYEKIGVPPPTWCPECRLKRRLLWRNERTFYRRTCGLCQKNIISTYNPKQKFPVYCQKCWWGDKWDPYIYGIDFNFSRPFFEQFKELQNKVPMLNMENDDGIASTNSEYAQDFAFSKNCYLTSAGWYCDNVMYSYYTCYDKDILDSFVLNNSERCYECFESDRLFDSRYAATCFDSMNLFFCFDMRNCQNCFMCSGLRGKNYYIRNKPYSREAYLEEMQKENFGSRETVEKHKKEFEKIELKAPHKYAQILKSPMCTGHDILNSKLTRDAFWTEKTENSRYMVNIDGAKDCYDITNTGKISLCYESVTPDHSYAGFFTVYCWKCTFDSYSVNCHSSNNVFGCIALKHAEYSIFNKKYGKEEYEKLKAKIIEHMRQTGEYGEFFPSYISPHTYNESQISDYMPLTKAEAIKQGFNWYDEQSRDYKVTMPAEKVPDNIQTAQENIIEKVIGCAHSGVCNHKCSTAFKIIPRELQFYKKMNIPLPTLCPNCRYYERIAKRNPPQLWHRTCMCVQENHEHQGKCPNEFETSYAPDRPELVYCEKCYQSEVY